LIPLGLKAAFFVVVNPGYVTFGSHKIKSQPQKQFLKIKKKKNRKTSKYMKNRMHRECLPDHSPRPKVFQKRAGAVVRELVPLCGTRTNEASCFS